MLFYNSQEGPPLVQKWSPSIDIVMSGGDTCLHGTSNARHVAALAGLNTCRKDDYTTGENRKTATGPLLRPLPGFSATKPPKNRLESSQQAKHLTIAARGAILVSLRVAHGIHHE
jgi:hypothetical protein